MNSTLRKERNMKHLLELLGVLALSLSIAAIAGPGHDHGEGMAPAGTSNALPRFAVSSEAYELVGVLDGKRLTLYLDRADTTAPVEGAKLEVEFGGTRLKLDPKGPGEFEAVLETIPSTDTVPIAATIQAGSDADLLAGELVLHAAHPASVTAGRSGWQRGVLWAAAVAMLVVLLAMFLRRARRTTGAVS